MWDLCVKKNTVLNFQYHPKAKPTYIFQLSKKSFASNVHSLRDNPMAMLLLNFVVVVFYISLLLFTLLLFSFWWAFFSDWFPLLFFLSLSCFDFWCFPRAFLLLLFQRWLFLMKLISFSEIDLKGKVTPLSAWRTNVWTCKNPRF